MHIELSMNCYLATFKRFANVQYLSCTNVPLVTQHFQLIVSKIQRRKNTVDSGMLSARNGAILLPTLKVAQVTRC